MSEGNALTKWLSRDKEDGGRLAEKHATTSELSKTVSEYAALLERVAAERADLLKAISELQLKNAELSVGKVLFADLELELRELRVTAEKAVQAIAENRELGRRLTETREAVETLKQENAILKGQVTKLRNAQEPKPE